MATKQNSRNCKNAFHGVTRFIFLLICPPPPDITGIYPLRPTLPTPKVKMAAFYETSEYDVTFQKIFTAPALKDKLTYSADCSKDTTQLLNKLTN
jgi:hypothetical protein